MLATEIYYLMHQHQYDDATKAALHGIVQRNQNQSAVGGGDINILGLSVEVKRCETLAVEQWWRQCETSAMRNGDVPVLIYRQNRKAWQVVMPARVNLPNGAQVGHRATFDITFFKCWFAEWAKQKIDSGDINRI